MGAPSVEPRFRTPAFHVLLVPAPCTYWFSLGREVEYIYIWGLAQVKKGLGHILYFANQISTLKNKVVTQQTRMTIPDEVDIIVCGGGAAG